MAVPKPTTIGESLYWSYANLGMMEKALLDGVDKPGRLHFMIRAKLYSGLRKGTMHVRGYFDDEKLKLSLPRTCCYCGGTDRLSAEHIIPQQRGGKDAGENIVFACRSCNSSKGSKDLIAWMIGRGEFPSLYLLRRYLKQAIEYCAARDLLDVPLEEADQVEDPLPFDLKSIPHQYPGTAELQLWVGWRPESRAKTDSAG